MSAGGIRKFGHYSLDLDRGCLLVDGLEVPLRPKTFALLAFLTANPGRLISKDELIRAVWRGAEITDDVLVQGMGELRRALGTRGKGYIRTVPRRGYRFEVEVSTLPPVIDGSSQVVPLQPASSVAAMTTVAARPSSLHRWLLPAVLVLLVATAGATWILRGDRARLHTRPTIAVLPFANVGDPGRQYFADGLTQDLIRALGRFSSLTVADWEAVLPYRDLAGDPGKAARDLDLQYQIDGNVQRTAGHVFIKMRLLDSNGSPFWSREFNAPLAEFFPLQMRIVQEISAALALQVEDLELQRVAWTQPGNFDAYDYVLRARSASRHGPEGLAEARELLNHALKLDTGYAAAWSAKAWTYLISAAEGWGEAPARRLAQAEDAATRALQLDASDVAAHVVLGRIHLLNLRHEQARDEMEHALKINPNDALALEGYGELLVWLGHTDEGIEMLKTAMRIRSSLKGPQLFALAVAYYLKGRYREAIALASREQGSPAQSEIVTAPLLLLAACHGQLGERDVAGELLRRARDLDPLFDEHVPTFGTWLQQPQDLQRLRDGLVMAGQPVVWEIAASAGFNAALVAAR